MPRITNHSKSPEGLQLLQEFRVRVRELIEREGIAPSAFAKRAGLGNNTMYSLLSDGDASRSTLLAIARTAGVSIDWLVLGAGPAPEPPALLAIKQLVTGTLSNAFQTRFSSLPDPQKTAVISLASAAVSTLFSGGDGDQVQGRLMTTDHRVLSEWIVRSVQLRARSHADDDVTAACKALVPITIVRKKMFADTGKPDDMNLDIPPQEWHDGTD